MALSRTEFFDHACFQGETCLRIFHGLNRFSEDLDFSLLIPDSNYSWTHLLEVIKHEMKFFGFDIETTSKEKRDTAVKKAMVKDSSLVKHLSLAFTGKTSITPKIQIKLELDTHPPATGTIETVYMQFPSVAPITIQTLPTLFAGKLHALHCRPYSKGRDWYDFLWYTSMNVACDYSYLSSALDQSGPWAQGKIQADRVWLSHALAEKIHSTDWAATAEDVRRFLSHGEQRTLVFWNSELFYSRLQVLR